MLNIKEMNVQYITDPAGSRNAVIVPIDTFNALIEDVQDLATVAERHVEPTISHQQLLDELRADGYIQD